MISIIRRRRPAVLVAILLLGIPGRAPGGEWPAFRGGADRGGNPESGELPTELEALWVFRGKGYSSPRIDSSPAVIDGAVYAGVAEHSVFSPGGRVVSLEAETGHLRWERKVRFPVFSSPAVAGGKVLIGEGYHQDQGSRLYCLEAASGKELWVHPSKGHIESSPQVDQGRVYVGAGEDGLHCLDLESGRLLWSHPGLHVDISPWVTSGLVFAGTGYGKLGALCLSAKEGKVVWERELDLPVWGSPLVVGNRLYLGLGNGSFSRSAPEPRGALACLNARSGAPVWRTDVPDAVLTAAAHRKQKVLFGSRDGHLYAIDAGGGAVAWKRPLGGPVLASPVVGKERVAAVSATGRVVVASLDGGEELASVELSRLLGAETGVYSSPALSGGRLFLGTTTGALVCLGGKK